ncbi:MAG: MFS transporter [bacterium]
MRSLSRHAGTRSFLWIWSGLTISLLGSALTSFALGIRVFQDTGSTTRYALVMFCGALPPLVILPFAGPALDRLSRKRTLIGCDVLGALATGVMGLLAWKGALSLLWICPIVILVSAASALQWPAYSATVPLLVPTEQLGRASGLTQLAQATSQVAAPLVAGALVSTIGLAGIAAIDVVTFAFSIATLAVASIPAAPGAARPRPPYARDLALGWRYIFGHAGLAALLGMFALTNFFAELASVLFTPFVLTFSTPAALGTIVSVGGVGLLAGSLAMAVGGGPKRPAQGAAWFAALGGIAVAGAGFTTSIPALAAIVAVFFFFLPLTAGSSQVLWQRTVPHDIQGRVFASRAAIAMSIMPLASLAAGPLADRVFEPAMAMDGRWARSLGPFVGVGRGRGMALLLVASGALILLVASVFAVFSPLRRLDASAEAPRAAAPEPSPLTH